MIKIIDKEKCCGCTACYSICPKKCITMEADSEGFKYPAVDVASCINCNLCEKVCPVQAGFVKNRIIDTYVVRNVDERILGESTSGGAFSAFALSFINKGGAVVGAVVSKDGTIKHTMIQDNPEFIKRFRGSKYVQSDLNKTYLQIKEKLDKNVSVLFSGTSCQVAGLRNFLKKDYDNLLTIEVICHGTPSPMLWEKYLDYQKSKKNSGISSISFRNKTYGSTLR